jgi:glycosyltransferase involved in cell wall biosynthesis
MQLLYANPFDPEKKLLQAAPILSYMPVDGYNYPESWVTMLTLNTNVIAMSRHGQQLFRGSQLVYHGVDEGHFWPVSPERPIEIGGLTLTSKADCKRHLDHGEGFLILRVDSNSGRKDLSSTIHAVAPILEKHRDIELHLHAGTDPRMPGVNLETLLSRYNVAEQVTITDPMQAAWTTEQLNVLYNAADLFVSTSRGEGFGLTLLEALSCGVPVVAQNVSAIPEVVGGGGVVIEPQRRITVPAGQDLWLCDVEAFQSEIEALIFDQPRLARLGHEAWIHATQSFSWDYAADRFNDFIVRAAQWRGSTEAH